MRPVGTDEGVQLVVVEQAVQLDEHRIGLVGQFRHARKHVFHRIAVDQHGPPPLVAWSPHLATSPQPLFQATPGVTVSISHR